MAGLYDRIRSEADDKIHIHIFSAAVKLWARGKIQQPAVVSLFTLDGDALADLNAIAAKYGAFPNTTAGRLDRLEYLEVLEAANVGAEDGLLTEAQWRSMLGIA